jgi:hypothetical protein
MIHETPHFPIPNFFPFLHGSRPQTPLAWKRSDACAKLARQGKLLRPAHSPMVVPNAPYVKMFMYDVNVS